MTTTASRGPLEPRPAAVDATQTAEVESSDSAAAERSGSDVHGDAEGGESSWTWPARELRGRVLAEEDGRPLLEAVVRRREAAMPGSDGELLPLDAEGAFRCQLPAGSPDQVVVASAPGRLPQTEYDRVDLPGRVLRLALPLAAQVAGVVRAPPGESFDPGRVVVWSSVGDSVEPEADGRWSLRVRPGPQEVFAAMRDVGDDRGVPARVAHASVRVVAGETRGGVVLELVRMVRRRLHVRARGGALLPPRRSLRVEVAANLPRSLGYWALVPPDEVDAQWSERSCVPQVLATIHVPEGAHRVLVFQEGRPEPVGSADVQARVEDAADVEVLVDDPDLVRGVVDGSVREGRVALVQNGREVCAGQVGPGGEFALSAWLTPGAAYVFCGEGLLRFDPADRLRRTHLRVDATRGPPRVRGRLLGGEPVGGRRLMLRSGLLPDHRWFVDLEEDGTFDGECRCPGPVTVFLSDDDDREWEVETQRRERTVELVPGETLDLGELRLVPH